MGDVEFGVMRTFLPYSVGQGYLLPPDVNDWLSADHPVRFILAAVREQLDLSRIRQAYDSKFGRGAPPHDPTMMFTLLIYGYSFGVRSSRKLERSTFDDLAVRFLTGNQHPDHDCIATFYRRHKKEFEGLFSQVLALCVEAGMIKLGDIDLYLDGTKILANASRHQTVSYAKVRKTEEQLKATIAAISAEVDALDALEDKEEAQREAAGESPRDFKDPQKLRQTLDAARGRLDRVAKARTEMEQSARVEAEQKIQEARAKRDEHEKERKRGRKPNIPDVDELAKELCEEKRTNLTDPDSRLMIDGASKAIVQAYNSQAVAAAGSQVIVACDVTWEANDMHQLAPMAQRTAEALEQLGADDTTVRRLGADAGYLTVDGVADSRTDSFDLYIAPGRQTEQATDKVSGETPIAEEPVKGMQWYKPPPPPPAEPTPAALLREEMRNKIATPEGKEFYNHRSDGIESVFAEIKETRGFRRFLHRGEENVQAEWTLICIAHNLRKLWRQTQRQKQPTKKQPTVKPKSRKCESTPSICAQLGMQMA
jgi:transposase